MTELMSKARVATLGKSKSKGRYAGRRPLRIVEAQLPVDNDHGDEGHDPTNLEDVHAEPVILQPNHGRSLLAYFLFLLPLDIGRHA